MQYRRLGKTDLEVSIVGFGGIPIGTVPETEAIPIINRAMDVGINYFHTSPRYGDSAAKMGKVMKEVLGKHPGIDGKVVNQFVRELLK